MGREGKEEEMGWPSSNRPRVLDSITASHERRLRPEGKEGKRSEAVVAGEEQPRSILAPSFQNLFPAAARKKKGGGLGRKRRIEERQRKMRRSRGVKL